MERILVVEDDETLAMGIEYALKQENWDVRHAANIEEARRLFEGEDFNLILLDVMLPDGNGFSFCKEVRKISEVPVIFLTARDEEVNVVMGLESGADDYITKPFRVKELISRIKANLRRAGSSARKDGYNIIKSGNITVNPEEQRVFQSGKELILTPTEYKLLLAFMKNPFANLSREQLQEKVWSIDSDFVDDNTLSVHIRRLRGKIEEDPSTPTYIATVRGFGYKWCMESN